MIRAGFLNRRTPLRPVSAKRRAQKLDYQQAVAAVWLRDLGRCRNCPARHWLDPHHLRSQQRYPDLRCDPENMVLLCRACHQLVHDNPKWAKEKGLLR